LALLGRRQAVAVDVERGTLESLGGGAVADAGNLGNHGALGGDADHLEVEGATGPVVERPVGGNVLGAFGEGGDQDLAADAVGPRDAAQQNALFRPSVCRSVRPGLHPGPSSAPGVAYEASLAAAASAAAASRSSRFLPGLPLIGLWRGSRLARPAASRKRRTRSVGWAPTDSQCCTRSVLSRTRSAWSL